VADLPANPFEAHRPAIEAFCRRFGVKELSVFGSAAGVTSRPDSDVDLMIEFLPGYRFTFENTPEILDALQAIFGRPVDVVEKGSVANPLRYRRMLESARVLYVAPAA
jgi:predicted nucleotidyltransferase